MKKFEDMTDEEKQTVIEDASVASAKNMGAPKDLFHPNYGWILLDGKPTEAYKEFYKRELHALPTKEIPEIFLPIEEIDKEYNIETPFAKDTDAWEQVTVGMLKKMLEKLPDDYQIKYDSACGHINKGDFTIYHDDKTISING
jgi:hypothetical protein